jgi:hypothetical protein
MEHPEQLADEANLRAAWTSAGLDVAAWDVTSAREEARRLAASALRLRALDDELSAAQLKSTGPEDLHALLRGRP